MLQNYLKIALRNLWNRKAYTSINIFGLAVGMAACLLIVLYVRFEQNYDKHIERGSDLYRIELDAYRNGSLSYKSATSFPAIAPALKAEFPEVEATARLVEADGILSYNNVKFNETKIYFADAPFVSMFSLVMVQGNSTTALQDAGSMVISATLAKKYFGNENPLGKTIKLNSSSHAQMVNEPFVVRGVYVDVPKQAHLKIDALLSYQTFARRVRETTQSTSRVRNPAEENWGWYDFYTYVLLNRGTNPQAVQAKMPAFIQKHKGEELRRANGREEWLLQPVRDIHLFSDLNQEAEINGSAKAMNLLFVIAVFVLCIAWVNYINLSTARATERAKEVGIRKVLGAKRNEVMKQFLMESLLLNMLALVFALLLVEIALPIFQAFTDKTLAFADAGGIGFWMSAAMVLLIGSCAVSFYPALILSGFQPVTMLRGKFKNSARGIVLRKGLIVFQFAVAVVMIAGTFVVYRQLQYMQNQELGVNIDQTLVLKMAGASDSTYTERGETFKSQLKQLPGVRSVTASTSVPGEEILWTNGAQKLGDNTFATMYKLGVDYDFFNSYELKPLSGRTFKREFGTDTLAVVLNEEAVRVLNMGSPAQAINQRINNGGDTMRVIGVIEDFHQRGLKKAHDPLVLSLRLGGAQYYSIKVGSENIRETVERVQKEFAVVFPMNTMEYFFLDAFFNEQYKADEQFGNVFAVFAGLAILVACLGLFGLIAFAAEQRTKEIGIRKVLGASVASIIALLSKDFLKLVGIAIIIATPLAYWGMGKWLQDFAYRVELSWWLFAVSGLGAVLIAFITVASQAWRAAGANPVNSLRSE